MEKKIKKTAKMAVVETLELTFSAQDVLAMTKLCAAVRHAEHGEEAIGTLVNFVEALTDGIEFKSPSDLLGDLNEINNKRKEKSGETACQPATPKGPNDPDYDRINKGDDDLFNDDEVSNPETMA